MTAGQSLSSRRGLGGLAALAGGMLMTVSVFLPWLGYPSAGTTVTGWDTYALASGTAQWFTRHAFSAGGFSPGFAGVSVLLAGGLLVLLGAVMLLSLAGGAFRLGLAAILILGALALVAFIVGGSNLTSLYATGDPDAVTPEYGLFVLSAGAVMGLLGVWVGLGRGRSQGDL
jgi:hypothetical protein